MTKTVVSDMDGVLADLHTEWLRRYNEDYDDTLTVKDITDWDISKFVKPACGKKIFEYLSLPLYERVQPFNGAIEMVRVLRSVGYRVVVATACVRDTTDMKYDWLLKYGFITRAGSHRMSEDFVSAQDKGLLKCDLMLEDNGATALKVAATGAKVVLFDTAYNRGVNHPRIRRIKGWQEAEVILKILE